MVAWKKLVSVSLLCGVVFTAQAATGLPVYLSRVIVEDATSHRLHDESSESDQGMPWAFFGQVSCASVDGCRRGVASLEWKGELLVTNNSEGVPTLHLDVVLKEHTGSGIDVRTLRQQWPVGEASPTLELGSALKVRVASKEVR